MVIRKLSLRTHKKVTLALLAALVGCETTDRIPTAEKTLPASSQTRLTPVPLPPAPPIYAKGTTLQQGRQVERIAASISVFEALLTGDGDEPAWNDCDVFDNPKTAKAIDLALFSGNNSKVVELGDARALKISERLQRLNLSLSDIPPSSGISASPVRFVISGLDCRIQMAMKQRGIAASLRAYPEISRAYVRWQFRIADVADPGKR